MTLNDPSMITAEWLQTALSRGRAEPVMVRRLELEDIGAGVGQMARIFRAHLSGGRSCPPSVVVKIPSADRQIFRMCKRSGLYLTEDRFYRQVAATAPISVPALLHREFDDRTHDFVFVMEDLSARAGGGLYSGDEFIGASDAQAAAAVRALAILHARYWHAFEEDGPAALPPSLDGFRNMFHRGARRTQQYVYMFSAPRIPREFPGVLSEEETALLQGFGPRIADHLHKLDSGPLTLIHGDYRLANMFFSPDDPDTLALVDWQATDIACGLFDLAYFITTCLDDDLRRRKEGTLVETYHATLTGAGVRNLGLDECWRLYRACVLASLVRVVMAAGLPGMGSRPSAELTRLFLRRTVSAIHDMDAWSGMEGCKASAPGRVFAWLSRRTTRAGPAP